eukprot:30684-Pelagococcus_subviridis.AAC.2
MCGPVVSRHGLTSLAAAAAEEEEEEEEEGREAPSERKKKTHREHAEPSTVFHDLHRRAHPSAHLIKLLIELDPKRLKRQLRRVHRLVLLPFRPRDERRERLGRGRHPLARLSRETDGVRDSSRRGRVRGLPVRLDHSREIVSLHAA